MNTGFSVIAVLIPAMIGPLPSDGPQLEAKLCSGGTISIPLGPVDHSPPEECRLDACHAGNCRKKLI